MDTLTNEELAVLVQQGSLEAREMLAQKNMDLAFWLAHKFKNTGAPFDDLSSAALLGLTKSINKYVPGRGVRFNTYASKVMMNDIFMYLRGYRKHLCRGEISVHYELGEEGERFTILDTIEDESLEPVYDFEELHSLLDSVLETLSKRDRDIMELYLKHEMTQREIGQRIGINQSYVSRIIKRIMKKVRFRALQTGLIDS